MNPIHVEWLLSDHILYATLAGSITDDLFLELDTTLVKFIESSSAPQVHVFFDNREMRSIPTIKVYRQLQFTQHPRLGWGVSFGDNDLTRFFISAFVQMNQIYFHMTDTLRDCLDFLNHMDYKLAEEYDLMTLAR